MGGTEAAAAQFVGASAKPRLVIFRTAPKQCGRQLWLAHQACPPLVNPSLVPSLLSPVFAFSRLLPHSLQKRLCLSRHESTEYSPVQSRAQQRPAFSIVQSAALPSH